MKQILTSVKFAEVGMLKSLLEAEGIACTTRNEEIATTRGLISTTGWYDPELWVLHDEDYEKANAVIADWSSNESQVLLTWICPECNEEIQGQFSNCWQCGSERKEPAQ